MKKFVCLLISIFILVISCMSVSAVTGSGGGSAYGTADFSDRANEQTLSDYPFYIVSYRGGIGYCIQYFKNKPTVNSVHNHSDSAINIQFKISGDYCTDIFRYNSTSKTFNYERTNIGTGGYSNWYIRSDVYRDDDEPIYINGGFYILNYCNFDFEGYHAPFIPRVELEEPTNKNFQMPEIDDYLIDKNGDGNIDIFETISGFFQWLGACLSNFASGVFDFFNNFNNYLYTAFKIMFIPSDDYFEHKILELSSLLNNKFPIIAEVYTAINQFKTQISTGSGVCPVLQFQLMGAQCRIDFSFLNDSISIVRAIISAFMVIGTLRFIIKNVPAFIGNLGGAVPVLDNVSDKE